MGRKNPIVGSQSISSMTATAIVIAAILLSIAPAHAQQISELYAQRCAGCHGPKGKGDGPAGKFLTPKPTDFAASLKGKADDWIAKAIKGGGQAVGEAPVMPPSADLSDDQIKALVDYVKHLGS
jgi:mono/diheme cytochrome c family protein